MASHSIVAVQFLELIGPKPISRRSGDRAPCRKLSKKQSRPPKSYGRHPMCEDREHGWRLACVIGPAEPGSPPILEEESETRPCSEGDYRQPVVGRRQDEGSAQQERCYRQRFVNSRPNKEEH